MSVPQTGVITTANPVHICTNTGLFFAGTSISVFIATASVLVEFSTTLAAGVGSANWLPWSQGTVSASTNSSLNSACMAIRFTLISGATATWEVCGP